MAKRPDITTVTSGYTSQTTINTNFENVRDQFDNTLSRDGSTPNEMNADLDMNSNDILNADTITADSIILDGVPISGGTAGGSYPLTFDTRADLKSYWDTNPTLSEGVLLMVGELVWEVESTATMISDLQGLKPSGNILSITHFASENEGYDYAEANGLMVETSEPNRFRGSRLTDGFNDTQNNAHVSYAVQVNSSNASRVDYDYTRVADAEATADPGAGSWSTNAGRTVLRFNDDDNSSLTPPLNDRRKELLNLKEGMTVTLTDTSTSFAKFTVNADATGLTGYVELTDVTLTETGSGGFPAESRSCALTSEGTQRDIGFASHININDPLAAGDTTAIFGRAVSNVNADQNNLGVRASAIGVYGSAVLRGPEEDGTRITTGEVWGSYSAAGFNQGNGVELYGNRFDRAANAASGDPGSGMWGTQLNKTNLRISYTDQNGNDISSDLAAVGPGYKITFFESGTKVNRITWDIVSSGTDNGTYIEFTGLSGPDQGGTGTAFADECRIIIYDGNTATDGKLVGEEIKAANWGGTIYDPLTATGENLGKYNIDFVAGADADNAFQQPVSAMMHNGNDTVGGWLYGGIFRNVRNDYFHLYQPLGSDVRALNISKEDSDIGSWAEEVIVIPDGKGIGWRDSVGTTISPVITRTGTTTSVADNLDADRLYQNGVALELTRAEAVTYLGTTPTHTDGTKFYIDNLTYKWEVGSTEIPDLPNLVPVGLRTPQHYGAAGDGTTNDTTALQAWLDSVPSSGADREFESEPLYLPTGKYITGQLVYRGFTKIFGDSSRTSVLSLADNTDDHLLVPYNWANNNNFSENPVVIEDIGFDGNSANQTVPTHLLVVMGFQSVFSRNRFTDSTGSGIRLVVRTDNGTTITNNVPDNKYQFNKYMECQGGGFYADDDGESIIADQEFFGDVFEGCGAENVAQFHAERSAGFTLNQVRTFGGKSRYDVRMQDASRYNIVGGNFDLKAVGVTTGSADAASVYITHGGDRSGNITGAVVLLSSGVVDNGVTEYNGIKLDGNSDETVVSGVVISANGTVANGAPMSATSGVVGIYSAAEGGYPDASQLGGLGDIDGKTITSSNKITISSSFPAVELLETDGSYGARDIVNGNNYELQQTDNSGSFVSTVIKAPLGGAGNTSTQFFVNNNEKVRVTSSGLSILTTGATSPLDVNGDEIRIRTAQTPASATAAGNAGTIAWDADYIYVCTATNTWKRTALSTW